MTTGIKNYVESHRNITKILHCLIKELNMFNSIFEKCYSWCDVLLDLICTIPSCSVKNQSNGIWHESVQKFPTILAVMPSLFVIILNSYKLAEWCNLSGKFQLTRQKFHWLSFLICLLNSLQICTEQKMQWIHFSCIQTLQ